jgi:hypothetical protein
VPPGRRGGANGLHEAEVAAAREDVAHHVESGVDHAPGEVAAKGCHEQPVQGIAVEAGDQARVQGAGEHHDQPEQDFGEALRRIEIAIEKRNVTTPLLLLQGAGGAVRRAAPGPNAITSVNQAFQPWARCWPANS